MAATALQTTDSRRYGRRGHRDLGMRIWILPPDKSWILAGMPVDGERNLEWIVSEGSDHYHLQLKTSCNDGGSSFPHLPSSSKIPPGRKANWNPEEAYLSELKQKWIQATQRSDYGRHCDIPPS